jgi:hypothetical protein
MVIPRALALVAVIAACGYPDPQLPDRPGLGSDAGGSSDAAEGGIDAPPGTAMCPASCTMGCIGQVCATKLNDNQQGTVNQPLDQPFIISVSHTDGTPVDGLHLTFAVQSGGGSVTASDVVTASGRAQTSLILGTKAGPATVVVHETGASDAPVVFSATGLAGDPVTATPENSNQSGTAGSRLDSPFKVTVVDGYGNRKPGIDVTFTVTGGGGTVGGLGATTVQTDASGVAQVTLTLGPKAGGNTVSATVAGLQGTLPFAATGQPGTAASLSIVSGNNQTRAVATDLAPFVVALSDANGNAISGATVTFAVTMGEGTLTGTTTTDANGHAQTTLTLGPTAGKNNNEVTATVGALSAKFQASASPGPAATLTATQGMNQTAEVATVLSSPFEVTVSDAHDNAVPGISVTFAVTAGGGSIPAPATRTSDAQGHVQTTLTLGTHAGVNTVTASATGTTTLSISATGLAGQATQLAMSSGDGQSVTVATAAAPFVVIVTDVYDNPVDGVTVGFAVTAGGGSLSATSVATAASGRAQTTLTLGPRSGVNNTVTATAAGLTGSPVTFTATGLAGPPAKIAPVSGDGQSGEVTTPLVHPLVAVVQDAHDNLLPGVNVVFSITDGGGLLTQGGGTTDAMGQVSTQLSLGSSPGANHVQAAVGAVSFTFTATAHGLGPPSSTLINNNAGPPQAMTLADFNADGRPDVAALGVGVVAVFLNTTPTGATTATLGPEADISGVANGSQIASCDLDGDGRPDLMIPDPIHGGFSVLLNQTPAQSPNASFTLTGVQGLPFLRPSAIACGDIDGDGIPDVVTVSDQTTIFEVFVNQSQPGSLSFSENQLKTGVRADGLVLGDFDGDGKLDLVVSSSQGNSINLFINQSVPGNPKLLRFGEIGTGNGPFALTAADLNADGLLDLIEVNSLGSGVTMFVNTGDPANFQAQQLNLSFEASDLAVGDIDGDGRPDLVATSQSSNQVEVFINRTAAGAMPINLLPPAAFTTNSGPFVLGLGDFNADGRLDVCTLDQSPSSVSILLAD